MNGFSEINSLHYVCEEPLLAYYSFWTNSLPLLWGQFTHYPTTEKTEMFNLTFYSFLTVLFRHIGKKANTIIFIDGDP